MAGSAIQASGSLIGNVMGILVSSASVELLIDVARILASEAIESGSLIDDDPGAALSETGLLDSACREALIGPRVDSDWCGALPDAEVDSDRSGAFTGADVDSDWSGALTGVVAGGASNSNCLSDSCCEL